MRTMRTTFPSRLRSHPPRFVRGRHRYGDSRLRAVSAFCLVLSVLLYGVAPMATLWQAANGVRTGNVAALRDALDWKSVRAGLKQDLASAPVMAQPASAEDELPAFGSSFVTTVASHAIDNEVTPDSLMALLSGRTGAASGWRDAFGRLVSLRFTGPTRFDVAIRMGDPDAAPVLLSLGLEKWHWRITRIHLPSDDAAPAITHRT